VSCNILLVEDDDVAVEAIQRSMKKSDIHFPITVAEDGFVALDILRGMHAQRKVSEPLVVLLDLNMPRMNGFEFLQALRADEILKPTVVFVLTTSGSEVDRAKAYHENVAGYMIKDKVGPQFSKLFKLLNEYAAAVSLPNLHLS
jgi:CheY-like chemotaxis protein